MEVKLSILIATIPSREKAFNELLSNLQKQIVQNGFINDVQIIWDDRMSLNRGQKRNWLLSSANGEYVVFIDDDDLVTSNYVLLILNAIKSGSDCIGINGVITTNGSDKRKWYISKEYGSWFTGSDGTYFRTPNHISPVKRALALKAMFPEIHFGEDSEYSKRLLPYLTTETIIEQPIYHYDFYDKK